MKLLLVGATGLVGRQVLERALADERVAAVIAPVRRALPAQPKLQAPVIDFEKLPEDAAWWEVDGVICTLGTTLRTAGSKAGFRRVDHDYPLMVARLAKDHGATAFVLNSAMGADPSSVFFYSRTKGDLERDLGELDFKSLTLVRPGLIGGEREEVRTGERVMSVILSAAAPLLPRAWRINPADRIAEALLQAALRAEPGRHVIGSSELV